MLPRKKCRFSLYVVNLDPQTKPSSHWIVTHFYNNIAYYFEAMDMLQRTPIFCLSTKEMQIQSDIIAPATKTRQATPAGTITCISYINVQEV